jgi:FecR protein
MAKRLISANGRRLAALALLGALCACATTSAGPRPEAQPAGWRIVERIGEARYSPPGASAWVSATIGETLAEGSEVSTGRGGRLIVDAPGRHISVGPDSRFVLPDRHRDDQLDQRAGWLRYRIAEAEAEPFRIHTRSLELEVLAGVVDVHVNHLATEVTVKEGQVRVATPDGLRQSQMMAGQSAHAGGSDDMQLAVRLAPGAALQPVDPVIVPALHPKSSPTEMPRASAPASPPPAGLPARAPIAAAITPPDEHAAREAPLAPRREAAPKEARSHAALPATSLTEVSATARREVVAPRTPDRQAQPVDHRTTESEAARIRRGMFERLTAGMLDQVEPRHAAPVRR